MKGFQLIFSTLHNREHTNGENLVEWLKQSAEKFGIQGITVINASQGIGRDGKVYSASFFELAEQPIEVIMNVSEEECATFFAFLAEEKQNIFYTKSSIEYGTI